MLLLIVVSKFLAQTCIAEFPCIRVDSFDFINKSFTSNDGLDLC